MTDLGEHLQNLFLNISEKKNLRRLVLSSASQKK